MPDPDLKIRGGGGGGSGHPDPEIRKGGQSQFGLKIRGRGPPLDCHYLSHHLGFTIPGWENKYDSFLFF